MSAQAAGDDLDDEGTLVLEQHFAIVPEWIIDADISDAAYRLYSVLLRYGQSSGKRMPGRRTLATRLKKQSTDSVDRALKELVVIGAVVVERRRRGPQNLTNRYHVRSTPPVVQADPPVAAAVDVSVTGSKKGGRKFAATPRTGGGSRTSAATPGRTDAATLAADLRPDPVVPTQGKPPPPSPSPRLVAVLAALGLENLDEVVARCQESRRRLGLPTGRWTSRVLGEVLADAVLDKEWPAVAAVPALLSLAADRETRSPARLSCAGPWWDVKVLADVLGPDEAEELGWLEAQLAEQDGRRVWAQRWARSELTDRGEPLTRLAVARLACQLLGLDVRKAS